MRKRCVPGPLFGPGDEASHACTVNEKVIKGGLRSPR